MSDIYDMFGPDDGEDDIGFDDSDIDESEFDISMDEPSQPDSKKEPNNDIEIKKAEEQRKKEEKQRKREEQQRIEKEKEEEALRSAQKQRQQNIERNKRHPQPNVQEETTQVPTSEGENSPETSFTQQNSTNPNIEESSSTKNQQTETEPKQESQPNPTPEQSQEQSQSFEKQGTEKKVEEEPEPEVDPADVITDDMRLKYDWLHLNVIPDGVTRILKATFLFIVIFGIIVGVSLFFVMNKKMKVDTSTETVASEDFFAGFNSTETTTANTESTTESAKEDESFGGLFKDPVTTESTAPTQTTQAQANDPSSVQNATESPATAIQGSTKFKTVDELTLYIQSATNTIRDKQVATMTKLINGEIEKDKCTEKIEKYNSALNELSTLLMVNQSLYDSNTYSTLSGMVGERLLFGQNSINLIKKNTPYTEIKSTLGL